MYLIIDEQYRIYKSKILNGRIRGLAKRAKLSIVNLKTMQGINSAQWSNHSIIDDVGNLLPEWSDIQDLPDDFEIETKQVSPPF